jgi:hypothetical protein
MAISDFDKAIYGYIVGRALPKGTTRKALQAAVVVAIQTGRTVAPYVARGAIAAAPPVARAIANPYIGVPLGLAAATYGTQQYLEESGIQEDVNVARDRFMAALVPTAKKYKKKRQSMYNKAVSVAMKAIKKSTKGGPKGKLNNPKKIFGSVSRAVSKAKKGGKLSTKGVTGVIKKAISRFTSSWKLTKRGKPQRYTGGQR